MAFTMNFTIPSAIHLHATTTRERSAAPTEDRGGQADGWECGNAVPRVCLKIHSCNLHAPLCGKLVPKSVSVARYASRFRNQFPTNCDAHFAESNFQTRSCDCRQTAQGIMSDATSGVKERQHSGRRTKFPALSVCGVSTHSTFPPVRLPAASPPWAPRSVPVHFIFSLEKNMEKVLTKQTSSAIVRA